ncbi:hypothetical protein ACQ4PT_071131 [Festuca glaucescens]
MASSPSNVALKAAFDGKLRLLKRMAKKVDLRRAKDAKGQTALHFAADKGYLDMCKFLVEESGLDVNSARKTGETPMFYAALGGNVQVMRYLLDHGADPAMPEERGSTLLHNAAEEGGLSHPSVCSPSLEFRECCCLRHLEAVRLLLSKGVHVDPMDHRGAPLHLAASKDRVEVVKVLLEHGADPSRVANHVFSPLMMAICGESLKCMSLLIEDTLPVEQRIADLKARGKEAFGKGDYLTEMYFYGLDYKGAADAFLKALQLDPNSDEITEALREAVKAMEDLHV